MARMKFLCDAERCIECNGCVTACKQEHDVPWGVNRRRVVTINDGVPGERSISVACMHCSDAPCMAVCPVDCFYRTEEGVVLHDKDLCIGCGYCFYACPFGAPQFPQAGRVRRARQDGQVHVLRRRPGARRLAEASSRSTAATAWPKASCRPAPKCARPRRCSAATPTCSSDIYRERVTMRAARGTQGRSAVGLGHGVRPRRSADASAAARARRHRLPARGGQSHEAAHRVIACAPARARGSPAAASGRRSSSTSRAPIRASPTRRRTRAAPFNGDKTAMGAGDGNARPEPERVQADQVGAAMRRAHHRCAAVRAFARRRACFAAARRLRAVAAPVDARADRRGRRRKQQQRAAGHAAAQQRAGLEGSALRRAADDDRSRPRNQRADPVAGPDVARGARAAHLRGRHAGGARAPRARRVLLVMRGTRSRTPARSGRAHHRALHADGSLRALVPGDRLGDARHHRVSSSRSASRCCCR